MPRFWNKVLMSAALVTSVALAPTVMRADDHKDSREGRTYHDKEHNDDHSWNGQEDRAYRMWAKENHRKYNDFSKINERDQQTYWGWRHEHSDAVLKIDIH